MVKITQGKRETWEHAKECGLDSGIALISKHFDIADVCVIGNGRMSFVNEKPRKVVRIPAVPTKIDSKEVINKTKEQRKRYK